MYNQYLIPANTKNGKLIMGIFRPFDLVLFGTGVLITILALLIFSPSNIVAVMFALAPALVTGFLVVPVPYYHNMLTIIKELYEYVTNRQKYRWRGWCYKNGKKK